MRGRSALTHSIALVTLIAASQTSYAATQKYEAICLPKGEKCVVSMSEELIDINQKVQIPINKITSWDRGGKGTRPDAGMAAASLMLTPIIPIAVFGVFTSKHEYIFNIYYVNKEGVESLASIKFLNKKPQDSFSNFLGNITGLSNGSRTDKPIQLAKQRKEVESSIYFTMASEQSAIMDYAANCRLNSVYNCLALT